MKDESRTIWVWKEGRILETTPARPTVSALGRVGAEARTRGAEAMRPASFVRSGPMQS